MNQQTTNSLLLYETAKNIFEAGVSIIPAGDDPELGCAISVNVVHQRAFGQQIGGGVSTFGLYNALREDETFISVLAPLPGDIIISPTGTSTKPDSPVTHGHTGIIGKFGIMSNNSAVGLWQEHLTLDYWKQYYSVEGGFPVFFFRKI